MLIYHRSSFDSNTYSYANKDIVHLKHLIKSLIDTINELPPMYQTPSHGQSSTSNWCSNNNKMLYSLDPYQAATKENYDECNGFNYDLYLVYILRSDLYASLDIDLMNDDTIAYSIDDADLLKKWAYIYKLGSYRQRNFRCKTTKLYV